MAWNFIYADLRRWAFLGSNIEAGFDAAIEFQPHIKHKKVGPTGLYSSWNNIAAPSGTSQPATTITTSGEWIVGYQDYVEYSLRYHPTPTDYKLFRCVSPGWDNSPRRKNGYALLHDATPELFQHWTEQVLIQFHPYSNEENLFFVNAWNEWGEGNHLEPCQKWGTSYLESLQRALSSTNFK